MSNPLCAYLVCAWDTMRAMCDPADPLPDCEVSVCLSICQSLVSVEVSVSMDEPLLVHRVSQWGSLSLWMYNY
jgi:hypothetical protein